jgi:hypothetical protein
MTFGAAGVPAYGDDAMARIRTWCERGAAPLFLATSEGDPFGGAHNVNAWSDALPHATARIVPGAAHAMAIYYDVRDAALAWIGALT